jgi:hypothetical protein
MQIVAYTDFALLFASRTVNITKITEH